MLKKLLNIRNGRNLYWMSEAMTIERARHIMGNNVIGIEELSLCYKMQFAIPKTIPKIPFTEKQLIEKKDDYLLILGVGSFSDMRPVTIRNMINIFGKNPEDHEPCFYNQDWYEKEDFIDIKMADEWFLIRKTVYDSSRSIQPNELVKKYDFPNAIRCCYTFFVTWYGLGEKLWYHDFVWCSDTDHNGDRIYVGKYNDIDGVNKNGFSIHRHLGLRSCYGCID